MSRALIGIVVALWAGLAQAQEKPIDLWADALQNQSADVFEVFQVATERLPKIVVDPTLTQKGGRITEQWDVQIKAPATMNVAEWEAHLRANWPATMAKIAQRLKDCGCTLLGLKGGNATTSVQEVSGPYRGLVLRFTRSKTTLTAHVDILAGR
jgi:hypothetical protein